MSGIVGSKFNHRGSGLVGSLGTDGQHLLSSGAGVTNVFETVTAGGGMTLIELQTANTDATPVVDDLLFDGVFTSTYKDYLITGVIGIETAGVDLYFAFADGTSVKTDTNQLTTVQATSVASGHGLADVSFGQFSVGYLWLADDTNATSGQGPVFNMWVLDPLKTSSSLPKGVFNIGWQTSGGVWCTGNGSYYYASGASIDGFNISPSADGMNRYKVAVFGLHTT